MAMSGATLKSVAQTTIYNKLNTLMSPSLVAAGGDLAQAQIGWQNLANAITDAMLDIVTHIQTTAVVNTNLVSPAVAVASVSGVTTGPGVSGPGTGTVPPAAVGTVS